MADDVKDIKDDDSEYEYIELDEGEELPEDVEYEYVEVPVDEDGNLVQLAESDGNMDEVLDKILEDKPHDEVVIPEVPAKPKEEVVAAPTPVAVEQTGEVKNAPEITRAEKEVKTATAAIVKEEPKEVVLPSKKVPLSSEELLALAKEAMLNKSKPVGDVAATVEKKANDAHALEEVEEMKSVLEGSADVGEEIKDLIDEPVEDDFVDFDLEDEMPGEVESMDEFINEPVNLEDENLEDVKSSGVDEMATASVLDDVVEYEYVDASDENEVANDTTFYQVNDAPEVPSGAVMFLGNNGVEFCNGKDIIYIDVENAALWNLIIFDRKLVSLDENVKEITLPKESKSARYATLVKSGREQLDLFNEEKFVFEKPENEFFKGKEHFIYGKVGQSSGLVINDVVTIPVSKLKGKELSSLKPMSGMVVGGGKGSVLYFNGVYKVIG